jgi:hypothetical protein
MTTIWTRNVLFSGLLLTGLAGCGKAANEGDSSPSSAVSGDTHALSATREHQYPGAGFIVHEWGTDTVVVGSDGSLQRGLHHEEEDLPGFVYDRMKAGELSESVVVKMETPVTYFYSDAPRQVRVSVDFPRGVFTQWYPAVAGFSPGLGDRGDGPYDPVLDLRQPFLRPACADKYGVLGNGRLHWNNVEVRSRQAVPMLPEAPLDTFTWAHARDVAANLLTVSGVPGATDAPQDERFLFYRGLGNFELPLRVSSLLGGRISAVNETTLPVSAAVLINVGKDRGAFVLNRRGGDLLNVEVPSLDRAAALADFTGNLAYEVIALLDETGLYHDEAVAMVKTWKRQWFGTPGVRVLYLMPQSWTNSSIPLTVTPPPDELLRVMMIRVEVITPELEQLDTTMARLLASPTTEALAKQHFNSLGRFAEPRLRRALSLLGEPSYGQAYLGSITSAETRQRVGE